MQENSILQINESAVESSEFKHGDTLHHFRKDFTGAFTASKLIASQYEIPPGKASWPYHYHMANEEMFYILEGEGEMRTKEGTLPVRAGDFFRFPIGENGVHQLINTSPDKTLKYLDFGTTVEPDLVVQPDSQKIGVFAGGAPCQNKSIRTMWKYYRLGTELHYLDGE